MNYETLIESARVAQGAANVEMRSRPIGWFVLLTDVAILAVVLMIFGEYLKQRQPPVVIQPAECISVEIDRRWFEA